MNGMYILYNRYRYACVYVCGGVYICVRAHACVYVCAGMCMCVINKICVVALVVCDYCLSSTFSSLFNSLRLRNKYLDPYRWYGTLLWDTQCGYEDLPIYTPM